MLINQNTNAYLDDFNYVHICSSEEISSIFIECEGLEVLNIEGNNQNEQRVYLNENLVLNLEYIVIINNTIHVPLIKRGVVLTKEFDDMFYSNTELGAHIIDEKTVFRLWAPIASMVILKASLNDKIFVENLEYKNGVYEIIINENLELYEYTYLIKVNGVTKEVIDPYAISSTSNGRMSVVIDETKFQLDIDFIDKKEYDPVVYETSVRDFTSNLDLAFNKKGKYLGFCETNVVSKLGNKVGIDHVVDMGYDYIQLMPIYDFGSVNELIDDNLNYNWGYDPVQFFTFEGSYLENKDPLSRIKEPLDMIKSIKEHGLGVIMDVVFNHVYDHNTFSMGQITPFYPYRLTSEFDFLNGSICGNEIATERKMIGKFITDAVLFYTRFYMIDGFRFDLMGLMDINLINHIYEEVIKLNPNSIIYGEGWNMECGLDESLRATQLNASKLPNVGFFDDDFRDYIKGDNSDFKSFGIVNTIDYQKLNEDDFLDVDKSYLTNKQKVRYVSCHDDHTLYDYLSNTTLDELKVTDQIMQCYNYMFQLEGIKFVHSGCEFKRSKNGIKNTYNNTADINSIDWNLVDKNISIIENLKQLIKINKGDL